MADHEMRARLNTATHDVWQYADLPKWVQRCTEMREDGLYLVRSSGKQLIERGDWLIRDLDGEPSWVTDDEFRMQYERVQ